MSEPTPDEYAAALDRLLDGLLDDDAVAEGSADAQVRADTDSIARALGMIGGALAGDAPPAKGGAVGGGGASVRGGTVVAMSSWRHRMNPRVLAAAASLIVLLGVGIPVAMSTGGSSSNDSTTALSAPDSAAERGEGVVPTEPGTAGTTAATDTYAGTAAAAVPGAAAADTGTGGSAGTGATAAGGQTNDAQALAATGSAQAPVAGDSAAKSGAAARDANDLFADDVACARAIFVGTITDVKPTPDGAHFNVTFLVEDWISPESGPLTATYLIYGSTANSPGVDESVQAGQRRLFVIPGSAEKRMDSYRQKDWPETKKQVAAVRAERGGQGCS